MIGVPRKGGILVIQMNTGSSHLCITHYNITSQTEPMERSRKIRERLIECSSNGELNYTDELHILNHLITKFNPVSLSQYARQEGISVNGAKSRVKSGKVMFFKAIDKYFVID